MRFFPSRRLILILLLLAWVELSFLPACSIQGIKPDFFFSFLVFYAFRIHWKRVVALAFLIGLIQDLLSNSFFGLQTASYVGGATLLRFCAIRLDRNKLWIQLVSLFLFSWFTLNLYLGGSFLIQNYGVFDQWIFTKTFLIAVYTTAAGAFLFPLFEQWLKPVIREKQYELF